MIKKLWKQYSSSFGKQMCPICENKCISFYKKRRLSTSIYDNRCPNCKQELILVGKVHFIGKILWLLAILYDIIVLVINEINTLWISKMHLLFFIFINISYHFFKWFIDIPFSKIEKYDSTPMDDLIINAKKLKALIKKIFTKNIN